jgi:hypothetical protein
MMSQVPEPVLEERRLGAMGERLWRGAALAGILAIGASLVVAAVTPDGWHRFFFAYLLAFAFVLSLALGSLYFVLLHHLTNSGWSVVLRRIAELFAGTLPFLAVLGVPLLFGMGELYPWAHGAYAATHARAAYLNVPFFAVRGVIYFAVWGSLGRVYLRRSSAQDVSGDVSLTVTMRRWSAPAMIAFAVTLSFAAFDLLMSLDPGWYSTIFGVYYFAGSVVGMYALITILAFGLQRAGFLRSAISIEHYHDLGKLLFGFVIFWAYIAFSQYMLIWYANIPEETEWLARRQMNGWGWVGLLLVFGHFVVPFVVLLSRTPKRRPRLLAAAAVWMLVMHWVDLFWVVAPAGSPARPLPHLVDLTLLIALGAWFLAAAAFAVRRLSLVPERDPRLAESLTFENA